MKTTKFCTLSAIMMLAASSTGDLARIGAFVVDSETGCPIPNVKVTSSFSNDNGWKAWVRSAPIYHNSRFTDKQGYCKLQGKTNVGRAGCWVDNGAVSGYYGAAGKSFRFSSKDLFGVWQPDNLVATIRLQRVEHPIPLFVKKVGLADFKSGLGGVGWRNFTLRYDLVKGDWLPPFGKGETGDLEINSVLTITGKERKYRYATQKMGDVLFYTLTKNISVSGRDDAISPVEVKAGAGIRIRRVTGDVANTRIVQTRGKRKVVTKSGNWNCEYHDDYDEKRCYVFRIRTKYDEKGKMTSAYYGKIYGDFQFQGDETVGLKSIDFLYYLNPTPLDRNLEWDMKTNLCPGQEHGFAKRP